MSNSSDPDQFQVFVRSDLEQIFLQRSSAGNTTVKPVLNGHLKIDKTKVLKTNGSLMKVESIAECSYPL